jgi:hypothetical protein
MILAVPKEKVEKQGITRNASSKTSRKAKHVDL